MNYKETIMIPNQLFRFIPQLKSSCIIILLIVLRQTLGWYDPKTKQRKVRDWISYKQFQTKTGISVKTISQSINILISLNLIKATDYYGNELQTPESCKGKVRIFYQCLLIDRHKEGSTYVKKYRKRRYNLPITKLTPTKLTQQRGRIKKLSDAERLVEIFTSKLYQ